MKDLDRKVLDGGDADMAEETPRERLFDVLMRRIEAMAPYKEAMRSLMRSAPCNPGLALALNGLAVRSQPWMLTAAGIDAAGPRGAMRAQGLALLFAQVLRTWVDDDDAGARPHDGRARPRARRVASAGPACSTICCEFRRRPASSVSGLPRRAPRPRPARGSGGDVAIRRRSN